MKNISTYIKRHSIISDCTFCSIEGINYVNNVINSFEFNRPHRIDLDSIGMNTYFMYIYWF